MRMPNLLIVDGSDEFRAALSQTLQSHFRIHCCKTGSEALEYALRQHPDVLVLDLMLPGLDGFSLLSSLREARVRPIVLATTRLLSDYIVERTVQLNIGYLMVKPCDVTATAQRVLELSQERVPQIPQANPRTIVSDTLLELGISTKLKGFAYLQEAVLLMAEDPGLSVTKELYPAVGSLCHSSGMLVERSIRSAVDGAWRKRDEQVWRQYFRADASGGIPRPSNTLFISSLAKPLRDQMR